MIRTKFCLVIMLLICFRSTAPAKEWKGLISGVSTRSDVVRLFQTCGERTVPCEFEHQGDTIGIVFSGTVQDHFYQCSKELPLDTVLLVEVTPRLPLRLRSLRQGRSFKTLATMGKFSGYIDERAGLVLKTYKNTVVQLNYVAPADANRRRCEDYYSDPIKFVAVVTHCPPLSLQILFASN